MTNLKTPKLFFKIKSYNSEQLDLAFEDFISNLLRLLSEELADDDEKLSDQLKNTIVQVGHFNDLCVVMFDLGQEGEILSSANDMIEDVLQNVDQMVQDLCLTGGIKHSLKDILKYVGLILPQVDRKESENEAFMKDLNEQGAVLKLFLCGFAFRVAATLDKDTIANITDDFLSTGTDRISNYLALAFKGLNMRVKLSNEDTYQLAVERLKANNIDVPDAADLVDALGLFLTEETDLLQMYDNMPFVRDFLDALHDLAKTDIEAGYFSEKLLIQASFKTEGFKDLFDQLMEGMSD